MKKCLLIGCSNGQDLHKVFSKVFNSNNIEWINLSQGCMGNRYITAQLFEYVDDVGIPDFVYLQYTGLSRIDVPLDRKIIIPNYWCQKRTKKRTWVGSGGRNGGWQKCDMLKRFFAYMYDTELDEYGYDLSFQEIFCGIELCKNLKIPYNWSSYYDYTNPPNKMTKIDGHTNKIPNYIDMSHHIGEFPLNLAYELKEIPEDKVHYSNSISEQYLIRNKNKFNI